MDSAEPALLGASASESAGVTPLRDRLDDLLEEYLILLNEYNVARHNLCASLSSGHLSLAQANFSNPNRIRYGQDFYDERMKASTRIGINVKSGSFAFVEEPSSEESLPQDDVQEETKSTPVNPLTWFGVLVPPALRASQSSFKDAVSFIPTLVTLGNQMGEIEIEVRRTRKRLSKLS